MIVAVSSEAFNDSLRNSLEVIRNRCAEQCFLDGHTFTGPIALARLLGSTYPEVQQPLIIVGEYVTHVPRRLWAVGACMNVKGVYLVEVKRPDDAAVLAHELTHALGYDEVVAEAVEHLVGQGCSSPEDADYKADLYSEAWKSVLANDSDEIDIWRHPKWKLDTWSTEENPELEQRLKGQLGLL